MEADGVLGGVAEGDVDISDETQDFRFLAAITKRGGSTAIPKRGEKDFEPDGTNLQSNTLDDSRKAMFEALAVERGHTSKTRCTAIWRPTRKLAQVTQQHGVLFKSMGRADKTGTIYLLPEELIYMTERGSLECFYEDGASMSVQAVYAEVLEYTGGLERYQVYANLRRSGYAVARHPNRQYDDFLKAVNYRYMDVGGRGGQGGSAAGGGTTWGLGIFGSLFSSILSIGGRREDKFGPLLPHGTYRSYREVLDKVAIPQYSPPPLPPIFKRTEDPDFNITFHVWKPQPHFKKSNPGPPDFYVCVINANSTKVPTLTQMEGLFDSVISQPDTDKGLYQSLKDGRRNLILAIVDHAAISFLRFSDSCFGMHKLDVDPPPDARMRGKGGGQRSNQKKKT